MYLKWIHKEILQQKNNKKFCGSNVQPGIKWGSSMQY